MQVFPLHAGPFLHNSFFKVLLPSLLSMRIIDQTKAKKYTAYSTPVSMAMRPRNICRVTQVTTETEQSSTSKMVDN